MKIGFYEKCGKRALDVALSFIGLIIFSPLFFLLAILIRLESWGPAFFCQERIGKWGKLFRLVKFRTMLVDKDKYAFQFTPGDMRRITKIGKFLRKTKIDELPTLINVLRGELSLVGPRPEVPKYLDLFQGENKEILSIRPGITDFASIKYRNEEKLLADSKMPEKLYQEKILPDKLRLNLNYSKSVSFRCDIKVILNTAISLLPEI